MSNSTVGEGHGHSRSAFILVSGNAKPDSDFEFVKKPFLPATLVSAVRRLFAAKAVTKLSD